MIECVLRIGSDFHLLIIYDDTEGLLRSMWRLCVESRLNRTACCTTGKRSFLIFRECIVLGFLRISSRLVSVETTHSWFWVRDARIWLGGIVRMLQKHVHEGTRLVCRCGTVFLNEESFYAHLDRFGPFYDTTDA